MIEWEGFLQKLGSSSGNAGMNPELPDQDVERDDNVSVHSKFFSVSRSSHKKTLKRALGSKLKLDLASCATKPQNIAAQWHKGSSGQQMKG